MTISTQDRELIIAAVACGMNSVIIEEKLGFTPQQQNEVCRTASVQIEKAWRAAGIENWSRAGNAKLSYV